MIKKITLMILEYLFRKKSMLALMLTLGVGLISKDLIFFILKANLESASPFLSELEIEYGGYSLLPSIIGTFLIISVVVVFFIDKKRETSRTKILMYQSGLVNVLEESVKAEIYKRTKVKVPIIKSDIQGCVRNNQIINPEGALVEINDGIHRFIKSVQDSDLDSDLYYAGLVSVPFSFYTGVELDDRYNITVFDYDRIESKWKEISKSIFPGENKITIDEKGHNDGNSIVVIGCSYPVNLNEVKDSFREYPISCINISNVNPNNHWDKNFHSNLQQKFFELIQQLSAKGTKTVHLILAAQNSISFNLGRIYDNRNLPELIVYQYEKGAEKKYPWGVKMKTSGIPKAEIIRN